MRIALDAMGGDKAPLEAVRGALRSVEMGFVPAEGLVLVGDAGRLEEALRGEGGAGRGLAIHHAPEVIEMHELPVEALRRKRRSSIGACVELVKKGEAAGVVTAGHTGAAVAAAQLRLKMLEGIRRPGLAVAFEGAKGSTVLIDVGANLSCRPLDLFHYGVMASCYARDVLGIDRPRVALLSIGSEDEKGTELVRRTHESFRASPLEFVGNIEGQDLLGGAADVIVCEGFVGNVVLKTAEGAVEYLAGIFAKELGSRSPEIAREILPAIAKRLDYAEHGGALLLGIEGVVVIGHGRSDAKAIASAIRGAARFVQADVNHHIVAGLRALKGAVA
ncbi:MAG TPA: phosphate acyltransferase PlsX [Planctomycetota bacterium]|jgi:glycerol-3-phosphate acyltransferase PlsX|nr:phosphate acyltransferase PlsX [Planctomycetota bacterium]